jgi:hypothetical protein
VLDATGNQEAVAALGLELPAGVSSKTMCPLTKYTICSCGWLCLVPTQPFSMRCRTSIMLGLNDITCRRRPGSGTDISASFDGVPPQSHLQTCFLLEILETL